MVIKTIEEPKLRPTSLQELHISSWENEFLEGNKPSLILLTSFIKQHNESFLAVWVVLQTKSKTRLRIRLQKLKKGRLPDEMRCRTEGVGVDSKVRSVRVWCLEKKTKYPKKFRKVPGLQCEGAACSRGLDIRPADCLKNFQIHLSHIFHFLHIFDSAKRSTAPTEFSPSLEALVLKILRLGLRPEYFFFFQNQKYWKKQTQELDCGKS